MVLFETVAELPPMLIPPPYVAAVLPVIVLEAMVGRLLDEQSIPPSAGAVFPLMVLSAMVGEDVQQ